MNSVSCIPPAAVPVDRNIRNSPEQRGPPTGADAPVTAGNDAAQ